MNGPNKTVAKFKREYKGKTVRPISEFTAWMIAQAMTGETFDTMEQAQAAYAQASEEK
jgi:hypothetical protein